MHKGSEKCNKGKLIVHYIATTYAPIVVYLTASCIYSKHAIFVAYKLLPQLLFVHGSRNKNQNWKDYWHLLLKDWFCMSFVTS